jgi:HD-GYP domain-containing protein (c-di-GMP phosphodiesterase class II)
MHSVRTTKYFDDFLRFVGVRGGERKRLLLGAALHDIGKMAVPLSILQKNGALSQEERREIQKHPGVAFAWMTHLRYPAGLADIPYLHHERWDGSGYPRGLKGSAIPRHVRWFSIIDVWDAMRNPRPYRNAIPEEMVLQYLRDSSGTLFDPETVDVFLKWRRRYVRVERTAAMPSVARYPVVI